MSNKEFYYRKDFYNKLKNDLLYLSIYSMYFS